MSKMPPENAAAELYARSLRSMGVIQTAWRGDNSNIVRGTTTGKGVHLSNLAEDFEADVHLICDTERIRNAGNLPEDIPDEDHGPIFFNVKVHEVVDDPEGYGLPTHLAGRAGATLRDDMSNELASIAEQAGIDI